MEPWQVVFITMYGGMLSYLTITVIQQGKKIVMLQGIDKKIDTLQGDVNKLNTRFDTFIKNEIDILKDLAKRE